jgi:hypothetical protein
MSTSQRDSGDDGAAGRILAVRKMGSGLQFEMQWRGQQQTTWEAASRMRRLHPQLVAAFEQQQSSQQQAGSDEGATDDRVADDTQQSGNSPADSATLQRQVAELALLVKQQAQRADEQQQHARQQQSLIEQLRASPANSPPLSAQPSPQLSPPQEPSRNAAAAAVPAAESVSRFAKKEPRAQDLREYDGASGAKLDSWLDELSLASMLYELNARESVRFAASRLRGAALQWWLALGSSVQAAISDSSALAAALRARFQPVTAARTAREQLDKLVQGSRGVNEYIADFQRLHTQLPSMASEDAMYAFERGLRRELAVELRKQNVSSLQDAIALVARIGGLLQASATGSAPQGRVNQMDVDDGDSAPSLDDRIAKAVLNAMQSAHGGNGGSMGAKTQTQRGYQQEQAQRGGRGGARGGRFGGRGGGSDAAHIPKIPGVPAAIVEQRRAAGQCYRCGSAEHSRFDCPNATSASGN